MSYVNGFGASDPLAQQIEAATKAGGVVFDIFTGFINAGKPAPNQPPPSATVIFPPPAPPLISRNVLIAGGAAAALVGVLLILKKKKG